MIKNRLQSGFTLMETLIYIVLFSFMLTGAVVSVYQLMQGTTITSNKTIVNDEANFLLRKFNWALTGATAINNPAAGGTGSTLSITKLNFSPNPLIFKSAGAAVTLTRGIGGTALPLNSQNVAVSNLLFKHIAASGGKPEAVDVTFTISGQSFELVKYLRQ